MDPASGRGKYGWGCLRGNEVSLFSGLLDEIGEGRELGRWRRHEKYIVEGVVLLFDI